MYVSRSYIPMKRKLLYMENLHIKINALWLKKTQKFYNDQQFYNKTVCGLLNWKPYTKPKYWKVYFGIYIARVYQIGTNIWDRLYNIPYIRCNIYYCLGIVNKRSVTKPWKLQLNILFIAHSVNCITSSMLPPNLVHFFVFYYLDILWDMAMMKL